MENAKVKKDKINKIEKFKAKPNAKTEFAKKIRTVLFGRMLIVALLILIQLFLYVVFFSRLEKYITYFVGTNVLLSAFFLTFLVNTHNKNEFIIAWIFPTLFFPVFGIGFYFSLKYNFGGLHLRKKVEFVKKYSSLFLPNFENTKNDFCEDEKFYDISSYLYKYANCPTYKNFDAQYFSCGEDFFESLILDLQKAKRFIFIEFFIIEPCQILDKLLEILSSKVKDGVEVRILFDGIGSIALSSSILKNYFTSFGIDSRVWQKLIPVFNTGFNNRDHRKIVSIDGQIAYTGGINITDEYANILSKRFDYWKDAGIKIVGDAALSFTLMFLEQWNVMNKIQLKKKNFQCEDFSKFIVSKNILQSDFDFKNFEFLEEKDFFEKTTPVKNFVDEKFGGHLEEEKKSIDSGNLLNPKEKVEKNSSFVIPYQDDAFNGEDIAENLYKYILNRAQKNVYIMTPYVIVDESMVEALIFTARRGVDVEIIVPNHYDHFITFCVGRNFIKTLVENGVKVFAYDAGFIHSKVCVADFSFGSVGSVNLDYRSFYHHFECGAFLNNSKAIVDASKDFEKTKRDCVEITKENYKNISRVVRAVGFIFRIFSPLL